MEYLRIQSKDDLKDWLQFEEKLYFQGGKRNKIASVCIGAEKSILWRFQKRLRKTEYYINCNKKVRMIWSKLLLNRISNKYCLRIPPNVFGKGLKIMHCGPILINNDVRFGENARNSYEYSYCCSGNNCTPKFANNVIIGVGATVMGDIFIANRNVIGAGAVCNKSFYEENINIAGVPAKKVSER